MLNRIVLIGRLTADPELRYAAQSGTAIAKFRLAVDRPVFGQNKEKQTDFINIVVFGKQAESVNQYLRKGRLTAVDGRLNINVWEGQDGQKRSMPEVVADAVRFLEWGDGASGGGRSGGGESRGHQAPGGGYDNYDDPFSQGPQNYESAPASQGGGYPSQSAPPPRQDGPPQQSRQRPPSQPGPYEELSDAQIDEELYDDDDPFKV